MMKKNILTLVLCSVLASLLATSCFNNSKSRLKRMVEEVNKECPVETGICTFDHINYSDDVITFEYTINNPMLTVNKLRQKKDDARKIFANNLLKGSVRQVLEEIVNANSSLRLSIKEDALIEVVEDTTELNKQRHSIEVDPLKGGITFDFSHEELQQVLRAPQRDDNDLTLQSEVMMLNLMAPIEVDYATTLLGGKLTSQAFTYSYEYDDQAVKPSMITKQVLENLKKNHAKELKNNLRQAGGEALKRCFQACIDSNRSLDCHYKGKKTGHVFEYGFSPSELDDIIRKSEAVIDFDVDDLLNNL